MAVVLVQNLSTSVFDLDGIQNHTARPVRPVASTQSLTVVGSADMLTCLCGSQADDELAVCCRQDDCLGTLQCDGLPGAGACPEGKEQTGAAI